MKTEDFSYELPPDLIAQSPARPRDSSRLMVLSRWGKSLTHTHFNAIGGYLSPGDLLVLNQTRVIPARLYARKKPGGGRVELLLLQKTAPRTWDIIVGGKGVGQGRGLWLDMGRSEGPPLEAEVLAVLDGAQRSLQFSTELEPYLDEIGHIPLPPYIQAPVSDPADYQTVFARRPGSAAAPTAGLHFTPQLLADLDSQGITIAYVTLHIGLDTFAPVTEAQVENHKIHTEWCRLGPETAELINKTRQTGGRVIAVGTTSVRTLETAAHQAGADEVVSPHEGPTDLFIVPGYQYKAVDAMITNFHLPRSTLLVLVSAFAGRDRILSAYETAVQEGYRFYSFGDAMLIV